MTLFLTIAVMYGITFGIKDAKLFAGARQRLANSHTFFHQLFSCAYCIGFHSGWMTYLLMNPLPASLGLILRDAVIYAFAGVTVSGFLDAVLLRIEG